MTWTKLSDDFGDDCWTLSDAAFRLHVEALCWSNRKLLDLRIPVDDLRRFAKRPELVSELLGTGYWTQNGDHYVIRHHAQYQRSREDVVAQQAANRANGRKGGRPRKPPREQAQETHSVSDPPRETGTERDRPGLARTEDLPPVHEVPDSWFVQGRAAS